MATPLVHRSSRSLPLASALVATTFFAGACAAPPRKPDVPPYNADFSYRTPASGRKLDVTIGIISPQWTASGTLFRENHKGDDVLKNMLSSMSASFNEILLAKGFNTKGPFLALNDMTFPEKKGSDLLLYPEFDFQIEMKIENARNLAQPEARRSGGSGVAVLTSLINSGGGDPLERQSCDAVITVNGNIVFVAQEPLSGERMWIKRLDVSKGSERFADQHGALCSDVHKLNQEMKNAWAKAHEIVYQNSMKALDNYVNGEEFQLLKRQSLELRARKAY